jgi:endonuclease G, mitochondrial
VGIENLKTLLALLILITSFAESVEEPYNSPTPNPQPVFNFSGYSICYDARTKTPAWTYERLTNEGLIGNTNRSRFKFREHEETPEHLRATLNDYRNSGFDRGHLVPAGDCKASEEKMSDTFLLSNICPQNPQFNRGYWAKLERFVRNLTKTSTIVHIVTGPLFLPQEAEDGTRWVKYQVIGNGDVAVPTHFFKVIYLESSKESFAYILPNEPIDRDTPLESFKTTVKKVEQVAGIIFNTF